MTFFPSFIYKLVNVEPPGPTPLSVLPAGPTPVIVTSDTPELDTVLPAGYSMTPVDELELMLDDDVDKEDIPDELELDDVEEELNELNDDVLLDELDELELDEEDCVKNTL